MDKRTFLKSILFVSAGVFFSGFGRSLKAVPFRKKWDGIFRVPELPYSFDALEPFIDAETMKLHYTNHFTTFADQFNKSVSENNLNGKTAIEILRQSSRYPDEIRQSGGGYMNHKMFWRMIGPPTGSKPSPELLSAFQSNFGSFDNFRSSFTQAAGSVFGSGWVWLITDKNGKLRITTTLNHENPMMDVVQDKGFPVLCLDLWEHAYCLRKEHQCDQYVDAFWNVVNWETVNRRFQNRKKLATA